MKIFKQKIKKQYVYITKKDNKVYADLITGYKNPNTGSLYPKNIVAACKNESIQFEDQSIITDDDARPKLIEYDSGRKEFYHCGYLHSENGSEPSVVHGDYLEYHYYGMLHNEYDYAIPSKKEYYLLGEKVSELTAQWYSAAINKFKEKRKSKMVTKHIYALIRKYDSDSYYKDHYRKSTICSDPTTLFKNGISIYRIGENEYTFNLQLGMYSKSTSDFFRFGELNKGKSYYIYKGEDFIVYTGPNGTIHSIMSPSIIKRDPISIKDYYVYGINCDDPKDYIELLTEYYTSYVFPNVKKHGSTIELYKDMENFPIHTEHLNDMFKEYKTEIDKLKISYYLIKENISKGVR